MRMRGITRATAVVAPLILWVGVVVALVWLARRVDGTYYLDLDKTLLMKVQRLDRFAWAGPTFDAVNVLGTSAVLGGVALAAFAVLALRGERLPALLFAGALPMRYVQLLLRDLINRPFDFDRKPLPARLVGEDSFPSGHVVGEVIIYGLVFAFADRLVPWRPLSALLRAACLAAIVLGAPARMYTGAHWPTDVAGGVLLALAYLIPALWCEARAGEARRGRELARDAGLVRAKEAAPRPPGPPPDAAPVTRR